MYTKPMIFPLDADGLLYALEDEQGNHIGTGSREVCQFLLRLMSGSSLTIKPSAQPSQRIGTAPAATMTQMSSAEARPLRPSK